MKIRTVIMLTSLVVCAGCANPWVTAASASATPALSDTPIQATAETIQGSATPAASAEPTASLPDTGTPVLETWKGLPTYPESEPGMYFTLVFDSNRWQRGQNNLGQDDLIHRLIPGCTLAPASGRGLPANMAVTGNYDRLLGEILYEVTIININGIPSQANYFGGDGLILTGFQVNFQDRSTACQSEAELVLATLYSSTGNP